MKSPAPLEVPKLIARRDSGCLHAVTFKCEIMSHSGPAH